MFSALFAHWRLTPIYAVLLAITDCGATHWMRGSSHHYVEGPFFSLAFPVLGSLFIWINWRYKLVWKGSRKEASFLSKLITTIFALIVIAWPTYRIFNSYADVDEQRYRLVFLTPEADALEVRYDEIQEIRVIVRQYLNEKGKSIDGPAVLVCLLHDGNKVVFPYYNFPKVSGDKFLEYARFKEIPITDMR